MRKVNQLPWGSKTVWDVEGRKDAKGALITRKINVEIVMSEYFRTDVCGIQIWSAVKKQQQTFECCRYSKQSIYSGNAGRRRPW